EPAGSAMSDYLVEMIGISKRFPGVQALRKVDLRIRHGEILCLLGENGAGKSTLMKILTGVYKPDQGRILLDGQPLDLTCPRDAYTRGINIIFQEFNLCPNLSAMENVFLGNENRGRQGLFSYKLTRQRAEALFSRLRIDIDPRVPVEQLGVAQQQLIEISKALAQDTRLLIMDEPTSALADKEIESLFGIMRDLKNRGISVVFISHKLEEVLEITDRIVVLRDGENSGNIATEDADEGSLITMMVGRTLDRFYAVRKKQPDSGIAVEVRHLSGPPKIRDVSFSVQRGEILGLAGLVGAGRTELAKLIIGAVRKESGEIVLNGRPVAIVSPSDAVAAHIAYLPEDRKNLALVLGMSARENITMSIHKRIRGLFNLISRAKEHAISDLYIRNLRVKVSSREQRLDTLSGGNQQKVVIAKALAGEPWFLILDEPTRGIDVGAKAEVHSIIAELADEGVAVLVISSELPEILHLSDRILVMHEGRITADISREEADQERIMRAAIGREKQAI
ncbi:sugar ABC transporter ATP-binding protein, partial [Salinispira pacifica]